MPRTFSSAAVIAVGQRLDLGLAARPQLAGDDEFLVVLVEDRLVGGLAVRRIMRSLEHHLGGKRQPAAGRSDADLRLVVDRHFEQPEMRVLLAVREQRGSVEFGHVAALAAACGIL